jgi:rubrerythrin
MTMSTITVIDADGGVHQTLSSALEAAGWQTSCVARVADAPPADAIIVAAQPGNPAAALADVMALRAKPESADAPLVLVANLERTGWDRTFESEGAFQVDAMFDMPVDADAVVRRLQGIFAAREEVEPLKNHPEFDKIIARAVANEEAAEAFYNKAAELVTDDTTRQGLLSLANDERDHKQLLLEFEAGGRSLPSGEIKAGAMVEALGAPDMTTELTPADAFLLAARKEKMAVEFYENWAALYGPGPERELLSGLAEVERRHKAHVEEMFCNAAFPEAW